jgi:hypothetical protein
MKRKGKGLYLMVLFLALLGLSQGMAIGQQTEGNKSETGKKALALRPNGRDNNTIRKDNLQKHIILQQKQDLPNQGKKLSGDIKPINPNKKAINNQKSATRRNRAIVRNRLNKR